MDDYKKFRYYYDHNCYIEALNQNIKFITYIIENNDVELISNLVKFIDPYKPVGKHGTNIIEREINFPQIGNIALYKELSVEQKLFVDALLRCKNKETLGLFFKKELGEEPVEFPKFLNFAIENDEDFAVKSLVDDFKRPLLQRHFDLAMRFNSMKCAKYIFIKFEYKTEKNLMDIYGQCIEDEDGFVKKWEKIIGCEITF